MSTATSSDGQVTARFITVTPKLAKEWLEKNVNNRTLSRGAVAVYSDDIKSGYWVLNGNTLVFDEEGELVDGQHRLHAVVESGKPTEFLVVEGVPDEAKLSIDAGRARRHADRLKIFADVERSNIVGAALAIIEQAVYGCWHKVSTTEMWQRYGELESSFEWARKHVSASFMLLAPVYAAIVYAHAAQGRAVEKFATDLESGVGPRAGSPVLLLRNHLTLLHGQLRLGTREERLALFKKTLRCVQAQIEGERLTRLNVADSAVEYFRQAA